MKDKIEATEIFKKNAKAKTKIVINRGGAGSSKSYSIAQLLVLRAAKYDGLKILMLRKTLPAVRYSIYLLLKEIFETLDISSQVKEQKTVYNFMINNSLIHLGGLDNPEKIKSTEWNYIWMEEATEFSYDDFMMLKLRLSRKPSSHGLTDQLFMSFNPTDQFHWIKTNVIDSQKEHVTEIHSTYHDNRFVPPAYRGELESLEENENFYRVYSLGEWGKLENIIYSNWEAVDSIPKEAEVVYGLDFGYNNPSSLIKISIIDNNPYLEELLYETKLTNSDLIEKLKALISNKNDFIYADSAEPQRIEELQRSGFIVFPADKSVKNGIDFVKRQPLHILRESINLIKEIRAYSWKKDNQGNILEEPVKFLDHAMDAVRYAIYTHLKDRCNLLNVTSGGNKQGIKWRF